MRSKHPFSVLLFYYVRHGTGDESKDFVWPVSKSALSDKRNISLNEPWSGWSSNAGWVNIFGSLIMFGIGHIHSTVLHPYQTLSLLLGTITFFVGLGWFVAVGLLHEENS